ncbi:MAG: DciA family protein [Gammaproteobacteria bacterium]|nr:DciA family protein [Gammaproteobacteria bacterium]
MKKPDGLSVREILDRASADLGTLTRTAKKIQSYDQLLNSVLDAPLRAHLQVANLRHGQLVLQADSPAWASKTRLRLAEILTAVNAASRDAPLAGIQVIARPASATSARQRTRPERISAANRKLLNDVASGTDNPRLGRSLRRLARRDP